MSETTAITTGGSSTKEKSEHPLTLKVMRLTRPTLFSSVIVNSDSKDLPGKILDHLLKNDIASVEGTETLAVGQFLLLPQSFGNLYLGETFACYVCVQNCCNNLVRDVILKSDLQTSTQKISLSQVRPLRELKPQETVDEVILHEVTEIGTHILVCEVSYTNEINQMKSFRKFFKIQVFNPLNVKTNFYNAESDEVYLEAQVQNMTIGPICLERVQLESSSSFEVKSLNHVNGRSIFGNVNIVQPQASRQFLYCLTPRPSATPSVSQIGKLDIIWRSNLGERGRLQTSQLQRMTVEEKDIRLSVISLPLEIHVEEPFNFICKIINKCSRKLDLVLNLENTNSDLIWCDVSGRKIGIIEPSVTKEISCSAVSLTTGFLNISGLRLTDQLLKKRYDFDDIAQVCSVIK